MEKRRRLLIGDDLGDIGGGKPLHIQGDEYVIVEATEDSDKVVVQIRLAPDVIGMLRKLDKAPDILRYLHRLSKRIKALEKGDDDASTAHPR